MILSGGIYETYQKQSFAFIIIAVIQEFKKSKYRIVNSFVYVTLCYDIIYFNDNSSSATVNLDGR